MNDIKEFKLARGQATQRTSGSQRAFPAVTWLTVDRGFAGESMICFACAFVFGFRNHGTKSANFTPELQYFRIIVDGIVE